MKATVVDWPGMDRVYIRVHNGMGHVFKFQTDPATHWFSSVPGVCHPVHDIIGCGDDRGTVGMVKARSTQ